MSSRLVMGEDLPFPIEEYESRQRAFTSAMEAAGLDAVLLYQQESLYYLYGYDQIGYWVYQAFVASPNRQPLAIGRRADADPEPDGASRLGACPGGQSRRQDAGLVRQRSAGEAVVGA